ncbi:hypothetical protein GCM10007989_20250 [Devosia pacifica]|uniref:Rap1a immunity protein domain-containing protein n=1 Tax=Devosia pacifica TaxID=1335967 RepID=A0A918S4T6_9HYPH|nr:hypothetical protein [Devosia pacifica]GHA24531.1 hypothetical protein GCM10007989_20250 [Devosia pacifica]
MAAARHIVMAALGLAVFAGSAHALPPTTQQQDQFYAVCVEISGNAELCRCKADAAMQLTDQRFMGVVISSMRGAAPAQADYTTYNSYVAQSNRICKPNY